MWENILGHDKQKQFLQRYLQAQERPHALLFLGAEGLGKKQLALAAAKALLCRSGTGADGCEACRLMNLADGNLSHPDFLLVQRQQDVSTGRYKDISIEQIKDLIGKAAFAPVMSANKVCIIEDVDRMSVAAANSFLKLLEEPPAGWVLLLLAQDEEKLLSTILSRVVRLRFQPVELPLVQQALVQRGTAAEQAEVLARLSEGSIGLAVKLLEQDIFFIRQQAWAFLEAVPVAAPIGYLADRIWQKKDFDRPQAILLVKIWQLLLHDLLLCKLQVQNGIYNCDMTGELVAMSRDWSLAALKKSLAHVQEAYAALEGSAGVRLALEAMALKIDQAYKE